MRRFEKQTYVLFLLLVLLFAALAQSVSVNAPLGHDESVYALGAGAALEGTADTGFDLHRPVGMRWLAMLGVLLGGTEIAFRSVAIFCSLTAFFVFFALGRRVVGPWPALWASGALLTSSNFLRRASELLSDLPSLLLLLSLLYVVIRECEREEGPTRWLLLCAPIAAAMFYLRYGTVLAMTGMAVAATVLWFQELRRAKLIVFGTCVSFLTTLVPHFVFSLQETGSLLGIIRIGGKAAGRKYLGEGLAFYWRRLPHSAFGTILSGLAIIGLVYGAWLIWKGIRVQRASVFLWIVAVFHTLTTGLLVHGEPRYIFFGVAVLALLGAKAVSEGLVSKLHTPLIIGALVVMAVAYNRASESAVLRAEKSRAHLGMVKAAATWIRGDAKGKSCQVMTSYVPQLTWYSKCSTYTFNRKNPGSQAARLQAQRRYIVLFDRGKRQPQGAQAATLEETFRSALVHRVPDPSGTFEDALVYVLP